MRVESFKKQTSSDFWKGHRGFERRPCKVCLACRDKGYSTRDVRAYPCSGCGNKGHLHVPRDALKNYKRAQVCGIEMQGLHWQMSPDGLRCMWSKERRGSVCPDVDISANVKSSLFGMPCVCSYGIFRTRYTRLPMRRMWQERPPPFSTDCSARLQPKKGSCNVGVR